MEHALSCPTLILYFYNLYGILQCAEPAITYCGMIQVLRNLNKLLLFLIQAVNYSKTWDFNPKPVQVLQEFYSKKELCVYCAAFDVQATRQ